MKRIILHPVLILAVLVKSLFHHEIALGNGCPAPSFSAPASFTAGDSPSSIAVGDFNSDGKLDLAVATDDFAATGTTIFGNIAILIANGDGTFQSRVIYSVSSSVVSIGTGDFDGDGKLDLAVTTRLPFPFRTGHDVAVLLGKGDGTFGSPVYYEAGSQPQALAVADFNGDGKSDLAVADGGDFNSDYAGGGVAVLLARGDGTFLAATNYILGLSANALVAADFNGDGKMDIALGTASKQANSGSVSVLLGNGDGSFKAPAPQPVGGSYPYQVAAEDFNGDGNLDLAVFKIDSGGISILLGQGDGNFQKVGDDQVVSNASYFNVGDLNGDGKPDLVNSRPGTGLSVILGNGNGTFQNAVAVDAAGSSGFVAIADLNGDHNLDLAIAGGGVVSIILNTCRSSGLPDLAIARVNSGSTGVTNTLVNVSWPYQAAGFVLESTTSLAPTNWLPAAEMAVTNGGRWEVTAPLNSPQRFFRLRKP